MGESLQLMIVADAGTAITDQLALADRLPRAVRPRGVAVFRWNLVTDLPAVPCRSTGPFIAGHVGGTAVDRGRAPPPRDRRAAAVAGLPVLGAPAVVHHGRAHPRLRHLGVGGRSRSNPLGEDLLDPYSLAYTIAAIGHPDPTCRPP